MISTRVNNEIYYAPIGYPLFYVWIKKRIIKLGWYWKLGQLKTTTSKVIIIVIRKVHLFNNIYIYMIKPMVT